MKDKAKFLKENYLLIPVLILSAVLNFANLKLEGYGNIYYAAGVKSMLQNFRNFFFVSFDPSGFVTIDKPPLGFWIQTISAKMFGFSGWSLILPQALSGVISVGLIYYLVKRSFGNMSGIVAALCLAVTPIFVAASRNNTIDNLLVLVLLFACWALSIAAEKGKVKYLIISLVLIGIGFNIKMVEAYMVAPAIYITYLLSSMITFKRKILHLSIGTIILLLVSLSWAIVVDLIPKDVRPYIGSSTNNSVIELIIGHNGLERLGLSNKSKISGKSNSSNFSINARAIDSTINRTMLNLSGGSTVNIEDSLKANMFRLISNKNISDQISWLLPLAFFGFFSAAINEKLKPPFNNSKKIDLLLWFLWLFPEFIYFSSTKDSFHTYYLTTMAPPIAALVGIGIIAMWEFYKEKTWKSYLLPAAISINGGIEILILSYNYNKSIVYKSVILETAILVFVSCIILSIVNPFRINKSTLGHIEKKEYGDDYKLIKVKIINKIVVSAALIGILIPPTVWSFTPIFYRMDPTSPSAGLELASNRQISIVNNSKLIKFLKANKSGEKYLVAVPSAMNYAADLIIQTGEPVMTIGGFSGFDKIITIDQFEQLVASKEIRYVIVKEGQGSESFNVGNPNHPLTDWIIKNGKRVNVREWQEVNTSDNKESVADESVQLYDLK
ncbi:MULTISPECIES: glycosyltransferase family 39 protein [unclassified Clostridium]|uniref:glycosyltransferase family 39 protein n=1 Tax=unclassified Clostridium TaxID=2614128 RepID=UPI000297C02F|nr:MULTISPECIES: glycosyltransferase family 39 protein [unclassified Clostridium]EKQ56795.1 MAG: PMT family glycosyltransferase, 4-amino-4-deoxy-L-arabinose transferase [Clostridium sp. Maddingley MBC34-26]